MRKEPKLNRIYPTPRLAIAFAVGSVFFFGMPWGGQLFLWLGLVYNAVFVILAVMDYMKLADSRACTVERKCENALSIGEQNPITIEARHRGSRPLRVVVRDDPPQEFETPTRTVSLDVQPDDLQKAVYRVKPNERGDYKFGDLYVRYTTSMGLVARQQTIPAELMVKVYPDILQTKKLLLLARENRTIQMGLRRSRIYGQGQEFERLRDYVPDDSMRHVDWKATARRRVLTTREYDVEQSQNIMILLDIGRSMASRTIEPDGKPGLTKADCAVNAAVLLSHVAVQSDDRVGLFCFARTPIAYVPPGKGLPHATVLMDALYPLKPRIEEPIYYDNFLLVSERQKKRSLVFLFTDLVDPEASSRLISSIGMLTRKHLVVCMALADYELPAIIENEPQETGDLYTQAVALSIIRGRRKALAQLMSQGVIALDATPSDLSVATVNKYLQLKRDARI